MHTNPIPTLMVHSTGIPGLIKLNDMIVGELTQDIQQKVPIPVSPTGTFFLSFIPLTGYKGQGNYFPITRKFIFHEGELAVPDPIDFWDNVFVMEWPGKLYEVTISPLYIPHPPQSSAIPKTIDQLIYDFDGNKTGEIATLFTDNYLHLVIEDPAADRLFFDYTPLYAHNSAGLSLKDMTGNGVPDIVIRGPAGDVTEFVSVISCINGRYQVLLDIYGHGIHLSEDSPAKVQILQRVYDTCQHGMLYTYSFDGETYTLSDLDIIWYGGEPQWPQSPQDAVKAFIDAIKLDLENEVMGFLSLSCSEHYNYQDIQKLVGSFENWIEPEYIFQSCPPPQVTLGLTYPIQPCYQKIELFCFEIIEEPGLQGKYKINRIQRM